MKATLEPYNSAESNINNIWIKFLEAGYNLDDNMYEKLLDLSDIKLKIDDILGLGHDKNNIELKKLIIKYVNKFIKLLIEFTDASKNKLDQLNNNVVKDRHEKLIISELEVFFRDISEKSKKMRLKEIDLIILQRERLIQSLTADYKKYMNDLNDEINLINKTKNKDNKLNNKKDHLLVEKNFVNKDYREKIYQFKKDIENLNHEKKIYNNRQQISSNRNLLIKNLENRKNTLIKKISEKNLNELIKKIRDRKDILISWDEFKNLFRFIVIKNEPSIQLKIAKRPDKNKSFKNRKKGSGKKMSKKFII